MTVCPCVIQEPYDTEEGGWTYLEWHNRHHHKSASYCSQT